MDPLPAIASIFGIVNFGIQPRSPPLRRATTVNELDASESFSAPSPQPGRRATVKEDKSTEPIFGPPDPSRRKTTFQEDPDHGDESVAVIDPGARNMQIVFGTERKVLGTTSTTRAEVSSVETKSIRDTPSRRGESISHYRSWSRRGSRRIMPWKLTR